MEVPDKEDSEEISFLKAEIERLRKTLHELTPSLPVLLKRRGFSIYKKEPSDDLMIPGGAHIAGYYEMLKKYSFRLFLRDVIKHQPSFTQAQVARYATKEVTGEYVEYLEEIGLAIREKDAYRLAKGPIRSFGETLEWFVAEIFRREFHAEAVWGVKMKRSMVGGDYDLLAKLEGSILYMEVKSSPPRQIYQSEINAFLDRTYDLLPELAIFFVDTELRMKDKMVPMFEEGLARLSPGTREVRRMEKELFEIVGKGPSIFIINAKDSIINNIGKVLAAYFRRKK